MSCFAEYLSHLVTLFLVQEVFIYLSIGGAPNLRIYEEKNRSHSSVVLSRSARDFPPKT